MRKSYRPLPLPPLPLRSPRAGWRSLNGALSIAIKINAVLPFVSIADKVGITDFKPSSSHKAAVPHYANRRRTSVIKLIDYYAGTKAWAKPTQLYGAVRAFYRHGPICPGIPCEQVGGPRLELCASNDSLRMKLQMVKRPEKAPRVNCATADVEQNQASADTYYVTKDTHDGFMVCSTHSFNDLFQGALPKHLVTPRHNQGRRESEGNHP